MGNASRWLFGCCALLACGGVFADPTPVKNVADEIGWLTVHAPRVFRRPVDANTGGATTEWVAIARRVSYADLDLAMHADVLELRKRIDESARTGCQQLAALSPLADLDTASCVREAVREALERAEALVAAAMGTHHTE